MSINNKPINVWPPLLGESVPSCSRPPEVSKHIPDTDKAEMDGDIFLSDIQEITSFVDCPICFEPVDIDQFNHNGGACNFCYHQLSNDSYDKAIDLERRLL